MFREKDLGPALIVLKFEFGLLGLSGKALRFRRQGSGFRF